MEGGERMVSWISGGVPVSDDAREGEGGSR